MERRYRAPQASHSVEDQIKACLYCNDAGYLELRERLYHFYVYARIAQPPRWCRIVYI
jgi:hypothetical protein